MMLAAAFLFHAHVPTDPPTARLYFDHAMRLYAGSKALRDRCGVLFSNWDTPCPHAMLLLVQGSGAYDSWFAIRLRDFAEAHVGFPDESGRFPNEADSAIMCAPRGGALLPLVLICFCACAQQWGPLRGVLRCALPRTVARSGLSLAWCTRRARAHSWGNGECVVRACGACVCRVTPKGARMYKPARARGSQIVWGGLRNMGTAGHIAAAVADFPGAPEYLRTRYACFAVSQLNYMLGDSGRSFMVGEGANSPVHPHSRDAFCARDWPISQCSNANFGSRTYENGNVRPPAGRSLFLRAPTNGHSAPRRSHSARPCIAQHFPTLHRTTRPHVRPRGRARTGAHAAALRVQIMVGALVSGPDIRDRYEDARANYLSSEVAIDYNTGFMMLTASVLGLPEGFWHGGDLAAVSEMCDAVHFRHYDWQA